MIEHADVCEVVEGGGQGDVMMNETQTVQWSCAWARVVYSAKCGCVGVTELSHSRECEIVCVRVCSYTW